jgi:hypothetical protein
VSDLATPFIPAPPAVPNEVAVVPPPPIGRDAIGRFTTGNPGKPRGARSKVAAEIDKMLEDAAPAAFKIIEYAASSHNVAAAMYIVDRVAPPRKGRPISLENFPTIESASDFVPALAAVASSVANGDLSVDEAASVAKVLREFLDVIESAHRLRSGMTPS